MIARITRGLHWRWEEDPSAPRILVVVTVESRGVETTLALDLSQFEREPLRMRPGAGAPGLAEAWLAVDTYLHQDDGRWLRVLLDMRDARLRQGPRFELRGDDRVIAWLALPETLRGRALPIELDVTLANKGLATEEERERGRDDLVDAAREALATYVRNPPHLAELERFRSSLPKRPARPPA